MARFTVVVEPLLVFDVELKKLTSIVKPRNNNLPMVWGWFLDTNLKWT